MSLVHGLSILGLYRESTSVLGIGEMARELGVHRSTASRLAATLCSCGYLARTSELGRYRLGPRLVQLGDLATRGLDVRTVAVEELRSLVEKIGETAHVGVLEGRESMTIAVVDGWHAMRLHAAVGKRAPAHCSSLGKALLTGLSDEELAEMYPEGLRLETRSPKTNRMPAKLRLDIAATRRRGYSLDDEELELGLRCVGAPVFDRSGEVVAAVSVSGPAARVSGQTLERLIEEVLGAASTISGRLGYSRSAPRLASAATDESMLPSL